MEIYANGTRMVGVYYDGARMERVFHNGIQVHQRFDGIFENIEVRTPGASFIGLDSVGRNGIRILDNENSLGYSAGEIVIDSAGIVSGPELVTDNGNPLIENLIMRVDGNGVQIGLRDLGGTSFWSSTLYFNKSTGWDNATRSATGGTSGKTISITGSGLSLRVNDQEGSSPWISVS